MPDADRAGRIVRAALGRSTSRPDGTDLTVRAIRLWLHEFGAATIETDPAWVVELLIGLITPERHRRRTGLVGAGSEGPSARPTASSPR